MNFRRALRAAMQKPSRVVAFRMRQELELIWARSSGHWRRLDRRARSLSRTEDVDWLLERLRTAIPWRPPGGQEGASLCARHFNGRSLNTACEEVTRGRATIFGRTLPIPEGDQWHRDPVFEMTWPRRYFRRHDFYESRDRPYDVKRAWEFSRLGFLVPIALASALTEGGSAHRRRLGRMTEILDDWTAENPVAYSVNWCPMEASMRLINLGLMWTALAFAPATAERRAASRSLFRLLITHVDFVYRTREYSDIRGNHYAANVASLMLGAGLLERAVPRTGRVARFAARELDREISLQFYGDGTNIEKSVPYHLLVLELFLIGAAAAKWSGRELTAAGLQRLSAAAGFLCAMRRPDGMVPVIGDNDSARLLAAGVEPERSPDGLLTLAYRLFGSHPPIRLADTLVGSLATPAGDGPSDIDDASLDRIELFHEGGFAAIRAGRSALAVDFGRIGLHGRGGHSHNDLLSFELSMGGRPIIVDRGCPIYTGDLALRDEYRSSRSHNTVCLDDAEHARLTGPWTVEDRAAATLHAHGSGPERHEMVIENLTFRKETPPVAHRRTLRLDRDGGGFECIDELDPGAREREIVRYFHFSPDCSIAAERAGQGIIMRCGRLIFRLEADGLEDGRWIRRDVSEGYDQAREAYALRLSTFSSKRLALHFSLHLVGGS